MAICSHKVQAKEVAADFTTEGNKAAREIQKTGIGVVDESSSPIDLQKQAAFVAAFLDALDQIGSEIFDGKMKSLTKTNSQDVIEQDTILDKKDWQIENFSGEHQIIIENLKMKYYQINAKYSNQNIILNNYRLISPPVEMLNFPLWSNNPKILDGIKIDSIEWLLPGKTESEINEAPKGYCQVTLSYDFNPSKLSSNKDYKNEIKRLSFRYIKNQSGGYTYKKVVITGTAYGGGNDTPDVIRKKALDEALRNAIEKVNGVLIQSITEVKNSEVTKDEILSQTIGIAQVLDKSFTPKFTSEGNYQVICTVTATIPLMELVAE